MNASIESPTAESSIIASSERKIWPITGGVHPPENKLQSTSRPIGQSFIPDTLVLPLAQHAGSPAEPVVQAGDKVLKGQLIARANGFVSAPVHAPTSGTITAIEKRAVAHPSGLHDHCIILEPDGEDRWCELHPVPDYTEVEPEQLVQRIRDAGISGMGGAGFPTAVKLAPATPVDTLILNGTECEPYITADDMLMREYAREIVQGAEILRYLLKAKIGLIGIEDNKPEAITALKLATMNTDIEVVVFPTVYPSGGEKQLIQILTGKEVPSGRLPADLGIVVQNVGTAVAVHDAIYQGKPLISRITTLTGEALEEPQNINVLLGTQAKDLLPKAKLNTQSLATLVVGGPMMGIEVDNLNIPVTKTTNCLIAGTLEEFPEPAIPQACIRCGLCAEACPSALLPQQLYWHAKAEHHDQLMHYNLFDCIECGACSYVCPSAIPLVQYYRAAKGAIRTQEAKHAKAERSKVRYEARLARLEKEKAEKEAKRKANAERAAKLKAAKAKAAQEGSASPAPEAEDPIKAAIARAKAKKAAAAAGTEQKATKAARPTLSPKQKELKIQLSMTKAQLKKTERALSMAEASGEGDLDTLKANQKMLSEQLDQQQKTYDAAASETPEPTVVEKSAKPARPTLSEEQKRLKIELSMTKAQLKKTERALAKAEASSEGDLDTLKASQKMLSEQQAQQQKAYDDAAAPKAPETTVTEKPVKKARPALSEEQKRLKIELSMAKAKLKKAQRALDDTEGGKGPLEAQISSLAQTISDLQKELDTQTASPAPEPTPAKDKPAKKTRPVLSEEEKRQKIELAMAKAALKKAERALATALEQGNESTEALQQAVDECRAHIDKLTQ